MEDEIVRDRETALLIGTLGAIAPADAAPLAVLDLGCGAGYALDMLARTHPEHQYCGVDFSRDLLAIAARRRISRCGLFGGDARSLPFRDESFDLVYTERCLINILNWEGQKVAIQEIWRLLRPMGYCLLIECFTDGMACLNQARKECGLPVLSEAHHNRYLDKEAFFEFVGRMFTVLRPGEGTIDARCIPRPNFLSSHYFVSRVLHPLITKGRQVRNTAFVKFFSWMPPHGEFAPLQAYLLRKRLP